MALTMPGRSAGCSRGCSRGVTNVPQPRVTRTRFTQVGTGIQRGSTVTELGMPGSPEITGRMPTGGGHDVECVPEADEARRDRGLRTRSHAFQRCSVNATIVLNVATLAISITALVISILLTLRQLRLTRGGNHLPVVLNAFKETRSAGGEIVELIEPPIHGGELWVIELNRAAAVSRLRVK